MNKIINLKLIKTVRCCIRLIGLKWQKSKRLFFMDILIGLLREAKALLSIVFPAVIIQLITDFAHMDKVLLFVFGYSLLLCMISIGIEILQRSLSDYSLRSLNYLILGLNRCAMILDYDRFEQKETMEKYDKAYDGIWNSSEADFLLFSVILSKLISFGITVYIFNTIHWLVSVLVTASLLIEFMLNSKLDKKLYQKNQELAKLNHKINYIADTAFDCRKNKDIFLYGVRDFFRGKFENESRKALEIDKAKRNEVHNTDIVVACIELIRTAAIYAAAVSKFLKGFLPIANFTLFANAARQMTYAIWQILRSFQKLLLASDYFDDYLQYTDMEKEAGQNGIHLPKEGIRSIEFQNVSYRYPNQSEYALKNISFTIIAGQTIALIGDNGAGKSTIVKLLLRLYRATAGDILLNGKSIYSYDYKEYLSYFAPVFQDFILYAFTIEENILFDKPQKEDELFQLLKEIGLEERIRLLPKGLHTPYTKSFYKEGVEFSGGEEQKLAIVRAFAKKGELLILDEPTAAIDPLAEYDIYKRIFQMNTEYTTIFISHRMSTTRFCDKILVLSDGQLVQEGSHEELMRQEGLYYRMFSMQIQYYEQKGKNA